MKNCEKDLFSMARNGDVGAYEKLIESYERKIFSLVLAAAGDRQQASELTQDIFIKVYKELKKEESPNKLSLLIYGTTRKMLLAKYKGSQRLSINGHGMNLV